MSSLTFYNTQNFHITNIATLPFFSFTCYFSVHLVFWKKFFAVQLPSRYHCYQLLLWTLLALVSWLVGRSVGWLDGCIVFVCVCVCVLFYLFIEFNSFTVGCWQIHFQIANNVQFSRFITFCGNKTNWIICALLCFQRISVFTYIYVHVCCSMCWLFGSAFCVSHTYCL